jgi:predicted dehydrogenase
MYALFARAIREGAIREGAVRDGESRQPTFATAVALHRLVDAVKHASDSGREVTFA